VICRECGVVAASDPLDKTLERMSREGCATLAVMNGSKLVGLLTLENNGELVTVKSAVGGKYWLSDCDSPIRQRFNSGFTQFISRLRVRFPPDVPIMNGRPQTLASTLPEKWLRRNKSNRPRN